MQIMNEVYAMIAFVYYWQQDFHYCIRLMRIIFLMLCLLDIFLNMGKESFSSSFYFVTTLLKANFKFWVSCCLITVGSFKAAL